MHRRWQDVGAFTVLVSLLLFGTAVCHGASDTDVTIIKAKKVVIEDRMITIVGEATTRLIGISGDYDPAYIGETWRGRPSDSLLIKSDQATFVIRRETLPTKEQLSPSGELTDQQSESLKAMKEAWQMTVDSAKALKAGQPVGRIGYYTPKVTIHENLIVAIDGYGFLYPKRD